MEPIKSIVATLRREKKDLEQQVGRVNEALAALGTQLEMPDLAAMRDAHQPHARAERGCEASHR